MIEQIAYVKLNGSFFNTETQLDFFLSSGTQNLCTHSIVYGQNGTGKSTISKIFLENKNGFSDPSKLSFYDNHNNQLGIPPNLFVFNEDYIDNNIKVEGDGISCICMFGRQGDFRKKIEVTQNALSRTTERKSNEMLLFESLKDKTKKSYENCKDTLKKLWSERDKEINNIYYRGKNLSEQKINTRVTDNILNEIVLNKDITEDKASIYDEFITQKISFEQICKNLQNKLNRFELCVQNLTNYEELKRALTKQIKRETKLTDRDERIIELITSLPDKYREQLEDNRDICPYCFRDIDDTVRKNINTIILKALSDNEYESYIKELNNLKDKYESYKYNIDLSQYLPFLEKESKDFNSANDDFSKEIEKIIELIRGRITQPYEEYIIPEEKDLLGNINKSFENLKNKLGSFKEAITDFNKKIDSVIECKKELQDLNSKIAWLEIKQSYDNYSQSRSKQNQQEKRVENFTKGKDALIQRLNKLNSNLKQYSIAKDSINEYLRYVFCDANRLVLSENGDYYSLSSKGVHLVSPKQLSIAERNILALCFFITQLNENLEVGKEFSRDSFIVIDDPISSIDNLNKIGIYSLFRFFVSEISKKSNSRILLLTHSLNATFDFYRIFENHIRSNGKKVTFAIHELKDKKLHDFKFKKRNEYSANIITIYEYASSNKINSSISIGNAMRRVLEAFSTFNYKLGIENITTNDQILAKIDEKLRPYFKNKMFRLVMHTLSHTEETVRTGSDFFEIVSENEKITTAKDLLSFLYLLDKNHLIYHLKGDSFKEEDIRDTLESWISEIKKLQSIS